MKTGQAGIELIKSFEGLELAGYLCPAGIPTRGYGHTGPEVKVGEKITPAQAEADLVKDLDKFERVVARMVRSVINKNQHGALVSFAYNLGATSLQISTLLKKVNANPNDPSIRGEFLKWNKARVKGVLKVLPGLTRRRAAEADLYFS
jgi:lysozyme